MSMTVPVVIDGITRSAIVNVTIDPIPTTPAPVPINPTTTSVVAGDVTVTPGQTIKGALVRGRIIVPTGVVANVINCVASSVDATADKAVISLTNTLIRPDLSSPTVQVGIYGHHVTIRGVETHDTVDGFRINNTYAPDAVWDIDGLYVHDHFWGMDHSQPNGLVHGDGGQVQNCTSVKIRNAWLTGLNNPAYGGPVQANSALMLGQDLGPIVNLDIQGNHLGGGLVACVNLAAKGKPFNAGTISNNIFIKQGLSAIAMIMAATTTCTTDGNVYDDGSPIVVNRNGA